MILQEHKLCRYCHPTLHSGSTLLAFHVPLLSLGARRKKPSLRFCYFSHSQNTFEIHLSLRSQLAVLCEEKRAPSVIYNPESTILYANCSWFSKITSSATSIMIYGARVSKSTLGSVGYRTDVYFIHFVQNDVVTHFSSTGD